MHLHVNLALTTNNTGVTLETFFYLDFLEIKANEASLLFINFIKVVNLQLHAYNKQMKK